MRKSRNLIVVGALSVALGGFGQAIAQVECEFPNPCAVKGEWNPLLANWPLLGIDATLLKTGKVLFIGEDPKPQRQTALFDPANPGSAPTLIADAKETNPLLDNVHCSGHAQLSIMGNSTVVFSAKFVVRAERLY